jgi:hypothetical protein
LVLAALAVDQTPEVTALTPYSVRSLQPVVEVVEGLVRTVVLAAAVATTIPPVGLETLRLFSHHKEIMVVAIAAPVMELGAAGVAHRRLDRRRAVVVKMPEMAGTAQPQAFLVRR